MESILTDAERISELRRRCLERKGDAWRETAAAYAESLEASADEPSWQIRKGYATRDILARTVFEIDDLELLVGRLAPRPVELGEDLSPAARQLVNRHPMSPGGQTGHAELDLSDLYQLGIDRLIETIQSTAAAAGPIGGTRAERRENTDTSQTAWRSFVLALQGLSTMIENAAATAAAAARATATARQRELREMAAVCTRIAHHPPETFRQAVQLHWFATFAVQHGEGVGLIVPGRLDRSLRPFYEADRAAGRLSREEALQLIESLYLLINEYVPDGLAVSVMVGGRDADGADATNELSYLCLEALRRTRLVYPTVGVCWHEGTPESLTTLAVELIAAGYSTPAFFGDETIQRGLRALGLPAGQVCNYINSTCVEITPVGCSNVWVASPYFNLCGMLLEIIDGAVTDPPSNFDELRRRYKALLAARIEDAVDQQNDLRQARREKGRKPLQSVFTRDCIKRGLDIDAGGAEVNWVECSFVGLANLADSLVVLEEELFRETRLDFAHMKAILDADFRDAERERLRFLNAYPKYGSGDARVDRFVGETVDLVRTLCSRQRVEPYASAFVPGAFVWIMHERLGSETGATPDGRRAGEPFADGAGPAQGREKRGPTAAILSTTSWDHSAFIGGVAFNMKFNSQVVDSSEGLRALRDLIVRYLKGGGFETQVNVVNRRTLLAAREHPDQYRDLVVRIGGYTDYFTRLSQGMQDEVIRRTEYAGA